MSNLTSIEKLTLAQAIYKVVADAVSTKNPNSMRSKIDEEIISAYNTDGIKSRDLRINGEKVGTYSVRTRKAATKDLPVLKDLSAYKAWMEDNADYAFAFAYSNPDFVKWVVNQGELPDGYELNHIEIPEQAIGTTLKVNVENVISAMGNELPNAVTGLLEGGY